MSVRVVRAGAYTTVQDRGRRGWQHEGVPVSGAMDAVALRIANALVGNAPDAAVLEATLHGPSLAFDRDSYVAVTGADMDARVDGRRIAPWWATPVAAGATLMLDGARTGCRSYIAVSGGIDAAPVLGSRSTYARANMGRIVARGDVLAIGDGSRIPTLPRGVDVRRLDLRRDSVRLIPGPHLCALSHSSWRTLFEEPFTLSPESDRMGLRFGSEAAALSLTNVIEVRSAPVAMGTMQLPPGGAPIVLMADRQTTGGYPRLGEIASIDLPVLAQLRPGDAIRFEEIGVEEAERLYMERERELDCLNRFLQMPSI